MAGSGGRRGGGLGAHSAHRVAPRRTCRAALVVLLLLVLSGLARAGIPLLFDDNGDDSGGGDGGRRAAARAALDFLQQLARAATRGQRPAILQLLPEGVRSLAAGGSAGAPGQLASQAAADARDFAVRVTRIRAADLLANPKRMRLDLPGLGSAVMITRRDDAGGCPDGTKLGPGCPWVGEVSLRPGFSWAVLQVVQAGASVGVTGALRVQDPETKEFRSYAITPLGLSDGLGITVITEISTPDVPDHPSPLPPKQLLTLSADPATDTTPPGGQWPLDPEALAGLPGYNASAAPTALAPPDVLAANAALWAINVSCDANGTVGGDANCTSPPAAPGIAALAFLASSGSYAHPADGSSNSSSNSSAGGTRRRRLLRGPDGRRTRLFGLGRGGRRRLLQAAQSVIDVAVVYSPEAATLAGSAAAVEANIRIALGMANLAYANSYINNVRLNLVAIAQTSSDGGTAKTVATNLNTLFNNATLQTWKLNVGADLLSLFTGPKAATDSCGVSYQTNTPSTAAARSALSVIAGTCWQTQNSFVHELGHNLGCDHIAPTGTATSTAAKPYAYGWARCDLASTLAFRDIMAYGTCTRIAMFSTPAFNYSGVPAGNAATGDCARNIREQGPGWAAVVAGSNPTTGFELRLTSNRQCVEMPLWTDGTQMLTNACNNATKQRYTVQADGSIKSTDATYTTKCWNVAGSGTAAGTMVTLSTCNGGNNQLWSQDPAGRWHPLHAPASCLERSASTGKLVINPCSTANTQLFLSRPALAVFAPFNQAIKSRLTNLCLEVQNNNFANGSPVGMNTCGTGANQRWYLEATTGLLRSAFNPNKCLMANSATAPTSAYISDCVTTSLNQRWVYDALSRLRPALSPVGICLDITGGNAAAGTKVQIAACNTLNQQKWYYP